MYTINNTRGGSANEQNRRFTKSLTLDALRVPINRTDHSSVVVLDPSAVITRIYFNCTTAVSASTSLQLALVDGAATTFPTTSATGLLVSSDNSVATTGLRGDDKDSVRALFATQAEPTIVAKYSGGTDVIQTGTVVVVVEGFYRDVSNTLTFAEAPDPA